jgi:hypothetical protein
MTGSVLLVNLADAGHQTVVKGVIKVVSRPAALGV